MKILLINGSPKGKRSNSLKLARSFVEGFKSAKESAGNTVEVEELEVASLSIGACRGCFACWNKTPGVCVIKDDMSQVIEKQLAADLIVWSFPLYYFNVPGLLKNLIDRQLPMSEPFMAERTDNYGSGSHVARYDMSAKKHVLVSTCGFYTAKDNYDSVINMFNHFLGKDCFEKIFCGQGELFKIKELSEKTNAYLEIVKKAGAEYAAGKINDATKTELGEMLFPKDVFEKMADASWGVEKSSGKKADEDLIFTTQMAALYNKASWDGKDRVLEMHYTDINKTYQILLGKEGSKVFTDESLTATTRIETPYEVWVKISRGEMRGDEALANQMYKVTGDFSLMMNWGKYFSGGHVAGAGTGAGAGASAGTSAGTATTAGTHTLKNPSMATMLIPWISFWIAVSINSAIGSLVSLGVCALMPLIMRKHKIIIWDQLSIATVAILSVISNITGKGHIVTNIGYIIFGLFWLCSCFSKEPLCAAYVKYNFGGESALKNPLFMKPNYILAVCWGVIYLLTAVWTFFLGKAGHVLLIPIINNLVPVCMGIFTSWFSRWYPAWKASGGKSAR